MEEANEDTWDRFDPTSESQLKRLEDLERECRLPVFAMTKEEEERETNEYGEDEEEPKDREGPIDESMSFYLWYEELSRRVENEKMSSGREYKKRLEHFDEACSTLLNEINGALSCLSGMETEHENVAKTAGALHAKCKELLTEQTQLENVLEKIQQPMQYFEELHRLRPLFGATKETSNEEKALVPGSKRFSVELQRLDECIRFMREHSRFRGANEYLSEFRRMQTHVIDVLRSGVTSPLSRVTEEILREVKETTCQSTAVLYVKMRSIGRALRPLIVEVERRVDDPLFATLLLDFYRAFYASRLKLLLPVAKVRLAEIDRELGSKVQSLTRDVCAYFRATIMDERQLLAEFFTSSAMSVGSRSDESEPMKKMMEELCSCMNDMLRPRIANQNDVDVLCDLMQVFNDVLNDAGDDDRSYTSSGKTARTDATRCFEDSIRSLVVDTERRLEERMTSMIDGSILSFVPSDADIDYPAKLLHARDSLVDRAEENAIAREQKGLYPTVGRALVYMSKMDVCKTSPRTFRRIARSCVRACARSLKNASTAIDRRASVLDGALFLLQQIMLFREQILPFGVLSETSSSKKLRRSRDVLEHIVRPIVNGDWSFLSSTQLASHDDVVAVAVKRTTDATTSTKEESGEAQPPSPPTKTGLMGRLFSLSDNPLLGAIRGGSSASVKVASSSDVAEQVEDDDAGADLDVHLRAACDRFFERALMFIGKSLMSIVRSSPVTSTHGVDRRRQHSEDIKGVLKDILPHLRSLKSKMSIYLSKESCEFLFETVVKKFISGCDVVGDTLTSSAGYTSTEIEEIRVLLGSIRSVVSNRVPEPSAKAQVMEL